MGYQPNTNKNYLIYHPHWTPKQGWKWVESYTPHVTFNEDVMFGDMLSPIGQQKTTSYWTNNIKLPANRISEPSNNGKPPQIIQTSQFEGENDPNTLANQLEIPAPKVPNIPQLTKLVTQPEKFVPIIPDIPKTNKPSMINNKLDIPTAKKAPVVPSNLWHQNNEKTIQNSSNSGNDQSLQLLSST